MESMLLTALWLICLLILCSTISGIIADYKGRNTFGWALLGIAFGPLSIICIGFLPICRNSDVKITKFRKCPACAEMVWREAKRCRYCGEMLTLILCTLCMLGGCASIIHGTTQKIPVSSDPSGAQVGVDDQNREYKTPCEIELERGTDHRLTISLVGYESAIVDIKHKVSAAVTGNAIFGGLIGMIVDSSNGAVFRLDPETIHSKLQPILHKDMQESRLPEPTVPQEPDYMIEIKSQSSVSAKIRYVAKLCNKGLITKDERNRLQAAILKNEI